MYLPTHFQQEDLIELFDCIEANPFASVMVVCEGEIEANHIPLELDRSVGEKGMLRGHIAKANPLFNLLEREQSAYVIFHADQAYISPNWYAGKQEHHRTVPTWNYRVVHVKGMMRKVDDEKYLRGILARLTRTHEATQAVPWKMGDAPNDFIAEQLEKIVAIEIEIDSIMGKFKVSQNRSAADAERVANALENSNAEMAASVRNYHAEKK
ncbi:FMN-binding negative transcriptional regulator [Acinetobacter tianfuensis]|uniref:FMN-binding negative transcriptional regulator n=1 Tax=Acinetobacter tianfuensis TaxID=2419603 RepID=A0A3A8ENW1_9GAMM|nr:FMN-binding negative transcriptional regulator [Acinetobacter tianfuensis]RKG32440.1 FMN-binding negative transcriptional regulator [Acinetobacter tianfuensis]